MFAGRFRMGWASASRRESRCRELAPRPVSQNYRAADDDRPRHAFQIGGRDDCGDRKQRPVARRSTKSHSCFPCDDPKKERGGTGRLDQTSESETRRVLSQRCHERQGRSTRRNHIRVVQRSDRRSDHKTQACKATNVWARETRSARSTPHRRQLNARCIKTASEPILLYAAAQ